MSRLPLQHMSMPPTIETRADFAPALLPPAPQKMLHPRIMSLVEGTVTIIWNPRSKEEHVPDARNSQLTGVAGVHFVASYISYLGLHAVPTVRNVAGPDLLVSSTDGATSLTLQVKTTSWAMRTRGRGENKRPHHYEWDIGWKSARMNFANLFFALVDLREFECLPDVFIVPSKIIADYFEGGDPNTWRRARYHPEIEDIEEYKNNWNLLERALD